MSEHAHLVSRLVLVVPRAWRAQDPRSVKAREISAERRGEAKVRLLRITRMRSLPQRPVGVDISRAARGDHQRRPRHEGARGGSCRRAVALGPQSPHLLDSLLATIGTGSWGATDVHVGRGSAAIDGVDQAVTILHAMEL